MTVTQTETIPNVLEGLREVEKEIVDEVDYAYHDLSMAVRQRADAWEKQIQISHTLAKTLGRWALSFMEKSSSNLLRIAQKSVLAKDAVEVVQLQIEFINITIGLCAEESAKLGQIMMSEATREAEL